MWEGQQQGWFPGPSVQCLCEAELQRDRVAWRPNLLVITNDAFWGEGWEVRPVGVGPCIGNPPQPLVDRRTNTTTGKTVHFQMVDITNQNKTRYETTEAWKKIEVGFSKTYPDAIKIIQIQKFSLVNSSIWLVLNCIIMGISPSISFAYASSIPMKLQTAMPGSPSICHMANPVNQTK